MFVEVLRNASEQSIRYQPKVTIYTTNMMTCIRIGFGKIARIHEEQFRKHGVRTLGVVEVNPERLTEIEDAGLNPFSSIQDAVACKPDFYDICTPSHARLKVLETLCALDSQAKILIEKPVCDFQDIENIQSMLQNHQGLVVVNENYASSHVTAQVRTVLSSRNIKPERLIVESTKHRGVDYQKGRYLDSKLGALGYEGSHLLAIVGEFGSEYEIEELLDTDIDSIELSTEGCAPKSGELPKVADQQGRQLLSHQGGAFMKYRARNGCTVDLYTSMSGLIGFPCPPHAYPGQKILHSDVHTRYRILRVDGVDSNGVPHQIVGFYEPITGFDRSQAQLLIFKNWVLDEQSAIFEDNTMSQHLLRAIRHFNCLEPNPYSAERALVDVTRLHEWSRTGWYDMDDSNEILGRKDIAEARLKEAMRFKLTPQ